MTIIGRRMFRGESFLKVLFVMVAFAITLGCEKSEKIETYDVTVQKKEPAEGHEHKAHPGGAPSAMGAHQIKGERMLVGMMITSKGAWFFKLLGGKKQLDPIKDDFFTFIKSVRFEKEEGKERVKVGWDLPKDWVVKPGSGMRYATIQVAPDEPSLALTVISLGLGATALLPNVNRWRAQLHLQPVNPSDLESQFERFEGPDYKGYILDLVGESEDTSESELSEGSSNRNAGKNLSSLPLTYEMPSNWVQDKKPKPMSMVSFSVSNTEQAVAVTVTPLPGMAGGVLKNLNRWRSQVKLPPMVEADLATQVKKMKMGNATGDFAVLKGAERAILGAIVKQENQNWFFKMIGPSDLVMKEQSNFEAFLKSFRFEGVGVKR